MDIQKYYNDRDDLPVYFVTYADPPAVCRPSFSTIDGPMTTPVHGWSSKAIEKVLSCPITKNEDLRTRVKGAKIVDASWDDKGGLIVCGMLPLKEAISDYDSDQTDLNTEEFGIKTVSLCASIDHDVIYSRSLAYCDNVTPRAFIPQDGYGGCNPASSLFYPHAPSFTRKLIRYQGNRCNLLRKNDFAGRPKLTEDDIKKHFPHRSFTSNAVLEKLSPFVVVKHARHEVFLPLGKMSDGRIFYVSDSFWDSLDETEQARVLLTIRKTKKPPIGIPKNLTYIV